VKTLQVRRRMLSLRLGLGRSKVDRMAIDSTLLQYTGVLLKANRTLSNK
jgi:hypothetical protein